MSSLGIEEKSEGAATTGQTFAFFMSIFKKLFCDHDFDAHGWSYIKCKKCNRVKYNPKRNGELMAVKLNKMYGNYPELMDQAKAGLVNRGKFNILDSLE